MIKDFIVALLSIIITISFLAMSYMAIFIPDKAVNQPLFNLVYGSVNLMAGTVLSYWFGSSKSSADKDKSIATMANTANVVTTQEKGT